MKVLYYHLQFALTTYPHSKSIGLGVHVIIIVEWISCHFWLNCALLDKSTKIGTGVVLPR